MAFRSIVTQELAKLLGVLAHPDRIFIVEELYKGEQEVKLLQQKLNISHSRVSQHLALLRSHKVVTERRKGRHVFYRLVYPDLSAWLLSSLKFLEFRVQQSDQLLLAMADARNLWMVEQPVQTQEESPPTEEPAAEKPEKNETAFSRMPSIPTSGQPRKGKHKGKLSS